MEIYPNKSGFSLQIFKTSSPKRVLAQANHLRVKFDGSSLWKLSCINPVPPSVSRRVFTHQATSLSSALVIALNGLVVVFVVSSEILRRRRQKRRLAAVREEDEPPPSDDKEKIKHVETVS